MIHKKIKAIVQLTSLIFTGIVMLEMLFYQSFNNTIVWALIICSAIAACVKCCLFSNRLFVSSIFQQSMYLCFVWLLFLACNYVSGLGCSIQIAISILVKVLIIYFIIRLVNYRLVKTEVKHMNQMLKNKKDDKQTIKSEHNDMSDL